MDLKLYQAARDGNTTLLNAYDTTNLTSLTPHQNTVLHITAIYGRQAFAEEVLNKCPSLLCLRNSEGDTALHLAARMGHINIAMLLTNRYRQRRAGGHEEPQLSTESSLWSMRNLENDTAVHVALRNGCTDVALHLLELDHHLAHLVNEAGEESPLLAHLVNGADESPLYLAAESGLLRVVEKLVSGGASSFSQEGPNGQTPLHVAAIKKHPDIVEVLLKKTPEFIPRVDSIGKTAIHYAAKQKSVKILNLLLTTNRALGYTIDKDGLSPLLIAAQSGGSRAVDSILNYCPDSVELVDPSNRNALHLAIANGNFFTVIRLLRRPEAKVLVKGRDNEGNTPMNLARNSFFFMFPCLCHEHQAPPECESETKRGSQLKM